MKILHIEGVNKELFEVPDEIIEKLPKKKNIALCTTIQFIKSIEKIKEQLEDAGKRVILLQGKHSSEKGQILGSDVPEIKEKVDLVLFVGDGLFHPKALFLKNNLPVFAYNPYNKEIKEIKENDIKDFEKFRKIALTKFHASENIGIITSIKPGQRVSDKELRDLEKRYNKKFYKFAADTINLSELENFPFIECWLNTACPRIAYDEAGKIKKAILNLEDLE